MTTVKQQWYTLCSFHTVQLYAFKLAMVDNAQPSKCADMWDFVHAHKNASCSSCSNALTLHLNGICHFPSDYTMLCY